MDIRVTFWVYSSAWKLVKTAVTPIGFADETNWGGGALLILLVVAVKSSRYMAPLPV